MLDNHFFWCVCYGSSPKHSLYSIYKCSDLITLFEYLKLYDDNFDEISDIFSFRSFPEFVDPEYVKIVN